MKTFILDIIPKIQRFSRQLEDVTKLTDQHWVALGTIGGRKTIYIFRKNLELLVSVNGKVSKGNWEYLGNNSILIDLDGESALYKHGFFDEDVLALKIDNNDEFAVFINENNFEGELNSITQLISYLENKYLPKDIIIEKEIEERTSTYKDEQAKENESEELPRNTPEQMEKSFRIFGRIFIIIILFYVLAILGGILPSIN